MSTREIAYSIFEQLTEEELLGFVALFKKAYPPKNNDIDERMRAFEELKSMRKSIPDIDTKSELYKYREERYGI